MQMIMLDILRYINIWSKPWIEKWNITSTSRVIHGTKQPLEITSFHNLAY